jgi:16S rRNA U516 pseudouridylate synthase RsuA-like enzyme
MGGAVMRLCDNPPCINPDHLRLGTKALNTQDMAEKNRSGLAKLTIEQVQYIRSHTLKGRGGNVRSMAEKFGVQIQQIHRILSGVRRQWITF